VFGICVALLLISERGEARPVWGHVDLAGGSERHNLDRHLKSWMGWISPVQIESESSVVRPIKRISVGKASQYDEVHGFRLGTLREVFSPNGAPPDSNIFLTRENCHVSKSRLFRLIADSPSLQSGTCEILSGHQSPKRSNAVGWSLPYGANPEIKSSISPYVILKAEAGKLSCIYGNPRTFASLPKIFFCCL
jgi:hypothetical protein